MNRAFHQPMRFGYTLVEAAVVLVILGIAATLLIPRLAGRGDLEVQAATRQLVADISWAQCDAVAGQGYRRLHFFEDGRGWCLLHVDEATFEEAFDPASAVYANDPWRTRRGDGDLIVDFVADERFSEVMISDVSLGGGRDLTFDRLGGTVSAPGLGAGPGSISLTDGQAVWNVELSPITGAVVVNRAQ